MHRITPIARILLGLTFLVFSLNYFIPFLPKPTTMSQGALAFVISFSASHLLTLIKAVELASAVALLANRAVPLALALLAPIVVGINAFHAAFAPDGLPLTVGIAVFELVLAWSYRGAFASMLRWRVSPEPVRAEDVEPTAVARAA